MSSSLSEFANIVQAALDRGISARELADKFECAESTIYHWASGLSRPRQRVAYEVIWGLEGQDVADAWMVHES